MIRKGSLVQFDVQKVAQNPVYAGLTGLKFKVASIAKKGAKSFAVVGAGILLPADCLAQIPQKKGKNYQTA